MQMKQLPLCHQTMSLCPEEELYRSFDEGVLLYFSLLTGKCRDPEWNRMETPHSCGEVCKKNRSARCKHHCNMYVQIHFVCIDTCTFVNAIDV